MEALYLRLFIAIIGFYADIIGKAKESSCSHQKHQLNCVQFVYNYDGDSIKFNVPGVHPLFGRRLRVRLRGVDAPEIRAVDRCEKVLANKARVFVTRRLEVASRISLVSIGRSKFSYIIADVVADGSSLSRDLLERKLAVPSYSSAKPKVDWCQYLDRRS